MDADVIIGGQNFVHPAGAIALLFSCLVILFARRDFIIPALLILIFVVPGAQRIVVISLDFSFLRIAILTALLRLWARGEGKETRICKVDVLLLLWAAWSIVSYATLMGSISALISRTGYMVDAVGAYFIGRAYVRDWQDVRRLIIFLGYCAIPILIVFLNERATGRNIFSVFGGIGEYALIREGKLRCQGPFSHPIMAGLFWASVMPWLYVLKIRREAGNAAILVMLFCTTLIVINTASSTPVMALIILLVGIMTFRFRRLVTAAKWVALFTLLAAQVVMDKGAAHLLARVNIFSGSTGWHRYHLIDQAMKHVNEWWLVGTQATAHWGAGLGDVTNQYVLEGVRGGLLGLILFVLFLTAQFGLIGGQLKSCRKREECWIYWSSGITLAIHALSFLSVSYFGQMVSAFYLFCGVTVAISVQNRINTHAESSAYEKNVTSH